MRPFGRYVPEETGSTVPVGNLVATYSRRDSSLEEILGAGGLLEQKWPGFRSRPAQLTIATIVSRALALRRPALIEAGTGVGKSLGLLGPALDWAMREKKTVLVSTATIALQGQYMRDLTHLVAILNPHFQRKYGCTASFAVAKGRRNYYCPASKGLRQGFEPETTALEDWLATTMTGDLSELPFNPMQKRLAPWLAANTARRCPGKKCPVQSSCWFYAAKDRCNATVVVANHALLAQDIKTQGVLPAWDALLVDEAHKLEPYVRNATGCATPLGVSALNDLAGRVAQFGLANRLADLGVELEVCLRAYARRYRNGSDSITIDPSQLGAAWADLERSICEECVIQIERLEQFVAHAPEAATLQMELDELALDIRKISEDGYVCWVEEERAGHHAVSITARDVAPMLGDLWRRGPCVLASATLATGTGVDAFEFAKRELGVQTQLCYQTPSPFDWSNRCLYVFPKRGAIQESDLRRPERWAERISPVIRNILRVSGGRAFCLFTSRAVMELVYRALAPELTGTVLMQDQLGKAETIAAFKAGKNPVLFALDSFWEGVDVPGDQLSVVIIDKIPFPAPSPLNDAKSAQYGRDAFFQFAVPMAIRHLQQGVGRLLRSEHDRGVVCILDPRVHKRYGRDILAALPGNALAALDREGPVNISGFLEGAA